MLAPFLYGCSIPEPKIDAKQFPNGKFEGPLVATLLPDGRSIKLEKEFGFVIPPDNRWWFLKVGSLTGLRYQK